MSKKKEEYYASRIARESLEDIKFPKQLSFEEIRPYFTKNGDYHSEEELDEIILGTAVFSEYLKSRQIYRFHPVLAEELYHSTELTFRIQDLNLPYHSFFMDISESKITVDGKEVQGVYVLNDIKDHELAIVALVKINAYQVVFMRGAMDYSDGKTIEEMIPELEGGYSDENSFYHLIFSLVAYLSSEKPDIVDRGKRNIIVRSKNKKPIPSSTRHWDVGYRYVDFYKKDLGFIPTDEDVMVSDHGTHQSPRRHLRAAHWHTYLYGPGKKLRKVLWVQACWVGTGESVDVVHVTKQEDII